MTALPFNNLYRHGFVRTAVCLPRLRVADPAANLDAVLELAHQASERTALLALFPELVLSSYAIDDLLQQQALLGGCLDALERLVAESARLHPVLVVGLPLRHEGKLFNCAAVVYRGRILGVIPKSYLPNYREYYEKRHFVPATAALSDSITLFGESLPFGPDLVFAASNLEGLALHVEICEDLWTPLPPSTWGALAGATILCNPSASNVTIGKAAYRELLVRSQSGRCVAAYLYAGAGWGESTTDLAWDGHGLICENGEVLARSQRFEREPQLLLADLDLDRLQQERMRLSSFGDAVERHRPRLVATRRLSFEVALPFGELPSGELPLERSVPRFPYVPARPDELDERCSEAYHIQVQGLAQRLEATGTQKLVIGVSGGLDSTQALLVAVQALERLGLPRDHVLAFTMPGFATSERTLANARALMKALSVSAGEIDIRPACEQMLRDIGHPAARGEPVHDVTYENVQAGARTSSLFRLANRNAAMVVGTSDLSELALGWATYGVGDHMSHYSVNASVPKTLIQHLIRWVVRGGRFGAAVNRTLQSILDTEISPELVPGQGAEGQPAQSTEERIGPFELQDFNLYYLSRYGYAPSKVAFLSHVAWGDRRRGEWPETIPESHRHEYDLTEIKRWLEVFLYRFFELSQFKRSAQPNAPKVGSGGSLSPRGDWRAPSDASARAWLEELRRNVP